MTHWKICCQEDAPYESVIKTDKLQVALVFHGLGGSRTSLSTQSMNLAAKGYIAVAIEFTDKTAGWTILPGKETILYHPYIFAEGEGEESEGYHSYRSNQSTHRTMQATTVMNFLQSQINSTPTDNALNVIAAIKWKSDDDMKSVFLESLASSGFRALDAPLLVGHSFGGCTAFHIACDNSKSTTSFRANWGVKGVITFDPWMFPLSDYVLTNAVLDSTPVLLLYTEKWQWPSNLKLEQSLVERCSRVIYARVRDAGHLSYSELGYLSPVIQSWLMNTVGNLNPIIMNYKLCRFVVLFTRCLDEQSSYNDKSLCGEMGRLGNGACVAPLVDKASSAQLMFLRNFEVKSSITGPMLVLAAKWI